MIRLETTTRYYLCGMQQDLLGQWEVWRAWGAKGSALGNSLRMHAPSEQAAAVLLAEVLSDRHKRGYVRVVLAHYASELRAGDAGAHDVLNDHTSRVLEGETA